MTPIGVSVAASSSMRMSYRVAGSVFAPHSTTTTRSSVAGSVGAAGESGQRGGGPVLDDQAVAVPQQPAGLDDVGVVDQHRPHPGPHGDGVGDVAEAASPQRVGSDARDADVGRAALGQGGVQRRDGRRLDPHHPRATLGRRRDPGHQPTAAHGHHDGVDGTGQVLEDLQAERPGAGGDRRLVVGVAVDRSGRGGVRDRGVVGSGVLAPAEHDLGAVGAQLVDLHGRCGLGDEDRGGHAELAGGVRVGQAGIAPGRDDDADARVEAAVLGGAEDPVEGAPCLERAGVLEELELEPAGPAEGVADVQQWRTTDAAGDALAGRLDVGEGDHAAILSRRRPPLRPGPSPRREACARAPARSPWARDSRPAPAGTPAPPEGDRGSR